MDEGKPAVSRRNFLAAAAASGAAVVATPPGAGQAAAQGAAGLAKSAPTSAPSHAQMEAEIGKPIKVAATMAEPGGRPGSDYMVDVLRALDIDYVATNPASSCRGLHESINNYAMNKKPELLTAMHEEVATAMAHGYAKVSGKPMGLLFHGTVGIQHAVMAFYNAWCDRVPMLVMSGNHIDAAHRPPGIPTTHAAQDPLSIVRDFTKWDDQPGSLQAAVESMMRAHKIAMTPPYGPVCISLDAHLQEGSAPASQIRIPKMTKVSPAQGNSEDVRDAARMLVAAQNPVIVVDRAARTHKFQGLLVELAELLGAGVVDQLGRQNFPSRHPLNQTSRARGVAAAADVLLGLELNDFWGIVNSYSDVAEPKQGRRAKEGAKLISINSRDLFLKANYQDFQRFQDVDLAMAADAEATLPALIEAVKSAMTPEARAAAAKRGAALGSAVAKQVERLIGVDATYAWDASPISTARLSAELWAVIKNEDWALVSRDVRLSNWPHRLWNFDKPYQYIGDSGGAGQGYGMGAAIGAALAHREHGRFVVNLQGDGDLMYGPGALWSAVHHKIPLMTVMHNNRAYHQEVMHVQRVGNWRDRGVERAHIGTTIENPHVDFATLARSMGMQGIGPIADPAELGPALRRAAQIVKAGEPVMVDVVSQPR
ncbi:MAG: twin-arginine translocation signal domain-containing protein [Beijerinckiaceae bacterium]|jgi:acetolactate synthase I/II/III large subunit|nr:twin-arginine translocation signal domain-containing protein [Beijerinckiaceae bacterium]